MKYLLGFIAALALTGVPAVVCSQEAEPSAVEAPKMSKRDLARKVVDASGVNDQWEDMFQLYADEMYKSQIEENPDLTAAQVEEQFNMILGIINDLKPEIIDIMVDVFVENYTEEELQAMYDFYSSPIGQSIIKKQVMVMKQTQDKMMTIIPKFIEKLTERYCRINGCEPDEADESESTIT